MNEKRKATASKEFDIDAFLIRVKEGMTTSKFKKGAVLFSQGDPADAVFYLHRGSLKVIVISDQGKEAVIGILSPGHFVGEGCLNAQPRRLSTVTAISDCVVTRLAKAAMIRSLHDSPEFSEVFIEHLLSRNARIEEDLSDQLFNCSEKRLARLLLRLANFGKESSLEPATLKLSQETLAEMVGTTRPRVSFFMNKFRRQGFIDYNGGLKIHRSLLNVVLHD